MVLSKNGMIGILLMTATASGVSCTSCDNKEHAQGNYVLPHERMDEPGPDVRASYESIRRAVAKVGNIERPNIGISPAFHGNRVACEVDADRRLHVLRLPRAREPLGSGQPQVLEYAVISGDGNPIWRPLASVYRADAPVLLLEGERIVGGVNGALNPQTGLRGKSFFVFPIGPDGEAQPVACIDEPNAVGRLATTDDGRVLVLSHEYINPLAEVSEIGLRLYSCRDGDTRVVAAPVSGSLHTKSVPKDYAIHVGTRGDIHIVYEGIRQESSPWQNALWHVTLDSKGALVSATALLEGIKFPYLTKVFAGPDSRLYVLEVYGGSGKAGPNDRFGHRVVPLQVQVDQPGPEARFFVDPWLQVHAVWFQGGEPRYLGPTEIPQ